MHRVFKQREAQVAEETRRWSVIGREFPGTRFAL
jgi:hypothetical protein